MVKQKQHQIKFMTMAFGGPNSYTGRSMAAAHKHLIEQRGLNSKHFDRVAGHLVSTLRGLGVAQELIDEVVEIVSPLKAIFPSPEARISELSNEDEAEMDRLMADE